MLESGFKLSPFDSRVLPLITTLSVNSGHTPNHASSTGGTKPNPLTVEFEAYREPVWMCLAAPSTTQLEQIGSCSPRTISYFLTIAHTVSAARDALTPGSGSEVLLKCLFL